MPERDVEEWRDEPDDEELQLRLLTPLTLRLCIFFFELRSPFLERFTIRPPSKHV